jgi:hypothetical protein
MATQTLSSNQSLGPTPSVRWEGIGGRFLTSNMVATTVFVYVSLATRAGFRGFSDVLLRELVALPLLASAFVVLLARLAAMPRDIMANTCRAVTSITLGLLATRRVYLASVTPGVETPSKTLYPIQRRFCSQSVISSY